MPHSAEIGFLSYFFFFFQVSSHTDLFFPSFYLTSAMAGIVKHLVFVCRVCYKVCEVGLAFSEFEKNEQSSDRALPQRVLEFSVDINPTSLQSLHAFSFRYLCLILSSRFNEIINFLAITSLQRL